MIPAGFEPTSPAWKANRRAPARAETTIVTDVKVPAWGLSCQDNPVRSGPSARRMRRGLPGVNSKL
jgi:hypothetical protein